MILAVFRGFLMEWRTSGDTIELVICDGAARAGRVVLARAKRSTTSHRD